MFAAKRPPQRRSNSSKIFFVRRNNLCGKVSFEENTPSGGSHGKEGGGRGGSNHQGAANVQAGNTKEARGHIGPRSGRPTKQTTHSAKAQGTWGRKPEKARDNWDAQKKRKKNPGQRGSDENCETQRGGGGGSNHQGAANGQAGKTKEARAHSEPRSGRPPKPCKCG